MGMSATEQRERLESDQAADAPAPRVRTRRVDPNTKSNTVDLRVVEDELVQSLATIGMFATPFLPHTGLVIMSRAGGQTKQTAKLVPGENGQPPKLKMVEEQKPGFASVIMKYAEKDKRILRAVIRFNTLMTSGDAMELGLQLAAAIAVDVHAVPVDITIPLPNGMGFQPIMGFIPDVVEEVAARQQAAADAAEAAAAEAQPNDNT